MGNLDSLHSLRELNFNILEPNCKYDDLEGKMSSEVINGVNMG